MTPRQANLLTAIGLLGLLATVALTAPRWAALLRAPAASPETEDPTAEESAPLVRGRRRRAPRDGSACASTSRPRTAKACSPRSERWPSRRTSPGSSARWWRSWPGARRPASSPTLPEGTRVLDVFVQARGVACVNLSAEAASGLPGGSRAELLTVYSVVNTIVDELPGGESRADRRERPGDPLARRPRGPVPAPAARHDARRAARALTVAGAALASPPPSPEAPAPGREKGRP